MGGNQWTDNADAPIPADICWRYPFDDVCAGTLFDAAHEDQTGFTFVPDAFSPGNTRVIITNDGGLFVYDWVANTIDGSANTRGLSVAQIWPDFRGNLAATSADPSYFLAGLFDNGVVRLDTDHAQKLRNVTGGGDGGHVDVSPDDANEAFYSID